MPPNPHALVSTDWVAQRLDQPGLVVVDVDEDVEAYDRSHIPGAIGWNWQRDLQHPVRRGLLSPRAFAALMERCGIARDTHVVLYGGHRNWFAAYAYWFLRLHGHPLVSLMDGGRRRWEQEGRPLVGEVTSRLPSHGYPAVPVDDSIRARRDEVLNRFVGAPAGTAIVDVRSPEEFRGERAAPPHLKAEAAMVAGHIPGAVNVPWACAVDPTTDLLRPVEELRAIYADAGISGLEEVVTYCRIGERSAHTWFVLHEVLGFERVRNYDGSWAEYGSLVDVPVAIGGG